MCAYSEDWVAQKVALLWDILLFPGINWSYQNVAQGIGTYACFPQNNSNKKHKFDTEIYHHVFLMSKIKVGQNVKLLPCMHHLAPFKLLSSWFVQICFPQFSLIKYNVIFNFNCYMNIGLDFYLWCDDLSLVVYTTFAVDLVLNMKITSILFNQWIDCSFCLARLCGTGIKRRICIYDQRGTSGNGQTCQGDGATEQAHYCRIWMWM